MAYFIGIDSSTTATKALLMDAEGAVIGVASTEYGYQTPRPLWSEQDPTSWWEGTAQSIRRVMDEAGVEASAVQGVGLTGQMHGLVLLGENGRVLRPAILWNDQRTGAECDAIREALGGRERLVEITGNDALTGFTAPKLLWVKRHEPEVYGKIRQVLLPKDYVRYRLTGQYATDKAGAAGTLLFDVKQRDWSPEVLDALGVERAWLPSTHEGPEVTGEVSAEAAEATGLAPGTPVVAGGGDQAAGAVGVGAVEEGVVSVVLGTSGVVFGSTHEPVVEPEGRLHAFCHAVPHMWHLMGVMLSAAGSLRWYRDTFAPETSFDDLLAPAEDVPAGSEGLLFLPYLTGERTPHPDPEARGAFVGLTVRHEQAHLTRAVLEGVAFGLRDNFAVMQEAGLARAEQVRLSGGGAQSPLWRQMLADVFGVALTTVTTTEAAAYGAALLAGVGADAWPDVPSACAHAVAEDQHIEPNADLAPVYDAAYDTYRALYPALQPTFHAAARAEASAEENPAEEAPQA